VVLGKATSIQVDNEEVKEQPDKDGRKATSTRPPLAATSEKLSERES